MPGSWGADAPAPPRPRRPRRKGRHRKGCRLLGASLVVLGVLGGLVVAACTWSFLATIIY
jgi:thiol:disulfide interchange protein